MKQSSVLFSVLLLASLSVLFLYGCGTVSSDKSSSVSASKILYVSDNLSGTWNIYAMNVDGSRQTLLTLNGSICASIPTPKSCGDPAPSPDGSKLAFNTNKNTTMEIYVQNFDGSGLIKLTNSPSDERYPSWSPDGVWITFTRDYGGTCRKILKARSDGSGSEEALAQTGTYDEKSDWSHDGSTIVFVSDRNSGLGYSELFTMDTNGSNQHNLFGSLESWSVSYPRWSPDGSKIAFQVDASFESSSDYNYNVFVILTSPPYTLTRITTDDSPVDNCQPEWSGDGSEIIFTSDKRHDGVFEIFSMNADGSNIQNLTSNETVSNLHPAWKI